MAFANHRARPRRWARWAVLAAFVAVGLLAATRSSTDDAIAAGDECFPGLGSCFNLDFIGKPPNAAPYHAAAIDSSCEPSGLPVQEYCVEEGDPLRFRVSRTGDLGAEIKVRVQLSGGVIGWDYAPTVISPQPEYPAASEDPPPDLPEVQFRPVIIELTFGAGSAIPTAVDNPILPGVLPTGPGIAQDGVVAFQMLNCNRPYDTRALSCAWLFPGTIPSTGTLGPNGEGYEGPGFRVTILSVAGGTIGPRSSAPVQVLGSTAPRIEAAPGVGEWTTAVEPQSGGDVVGDTVEITLTGEHFTPLGGVCNAPGFPYRAIDGADFVDNDGDGNLWERYDAPVPPDKQPAITPPARCLLRVEFWPLGLGVPTSPFPAPPPYYVYPDAPGRLTAVGPTTVRVRVPTTLQERAYDVRVRIVDPQAPQYPQGFSTADPDLYPEFSVLSRITPPRILADGRVRYDDQFYYWEDEVVTEMSTHTGPAHGGTFVRLFGRNFTAASCAPGVVKFGSVAAASCTFVNANTLEVTSPPKPEDPPIVHPPGLVNVTVNNSPATPANEFRYTGGPRIDSISPTVGPVSGGTLVKIFGSGFNMLAQGPDCIGPVYDGVFFGGTLAQSCQLISDSEIWATSPAWIGPATVQITVVHPATGSSEFTSAAQFRYASGPLIERLDPPYGPPSGGQEVRIHGQGFQPGAIVTFGGVTAPFVNVINQGEILAVSPPSGGRARVDVIVTVAGQPTANTPADDFYYSAPKVNAIEPNAGPTAGGNTVVIKGFNFTTNTEVWFGPTLATGLVFVSQLEIQVVVPARAAEGAVPVKIRTNCVDIDANGLTDNECSVNEPPLEPTYTYTNGPIVTVVNPNTGPVTGGTIVIITGTNFPASPVGVSVLFGDTPAISFNINGPTQMTAISPPRAEAGQVNITVKPATGMTSPAAPGALFAYTSATPVITGITPNSVPNTGNVTVVITGMGLSGAQCPAGVMFGIIPATSCTVINDTSITAVAPPNVIGETFVTVTTPHGTSQIANNFTYVKGTGSGGSGGTGGGGGGTGGGGGGGEPPTGQLVTYDLSFRWTLITWAGADTAVGEALKGADGKDVTSNVLAIFRWDAENGVWLGYFPAGTGLEGVNDFATLRRGLVYWVAVAGPEGTQWTVKDG
ncbi:MAG: IPT/TIG domain-containing protein [Dehalococcoidia bacterium]|nr:IPT/TIG domain-containing protein [Dehalococcoidia bacterium]